MSHMVRSLDSSQIRLDDCERCGNDPTRNFEIKNEEVPHVGNINTQSTYCPSILTSPPSRTGGLGAGPAAASASPLPTPSPYTSEEFE